MIVPSEQAVRNREILLERFICPHTLRDAVIIVGSYLHSGLLEWRKQVHEHFALNFPSYRRDMIRIFDELTPPEEQALFQLTSEILEAEQQDDGKRLPVLFQYIPN